jgi:hypothetical protein
MECRRRVQRLTAASSGLQPRDHATREKLPRRRQCWRAPLAPVPASSGKITRHRLSRGGDRAANNALYRIALVRMSAHRQTRDNVQRQVANGRSKKEILRLLKRAVAREMFRLLTRPAPVDDYRDLRPCPTSQTHHPGHRRHSFRRPGHHRLATRTRTPTQRSPRQPLPPMADRRLTP